MKVVVAESEAFYEMIERASLKVVEKISREEEWLTEERALVFLGLRNKLHLREIARKNNITISKPGKAIFYNRKSLIIYIEKAVVKLK